MERENRKVLISVKVSTLLLILIAIIVGIVLINKIKASIQNGSAELANNTNYEQEDVIEEQEPIRVIKADVSSRGTTTEEKRHSDVQENTKAEEIVLDNIKYRVTELKFVIFCVKMFVVEGI